MTTVLSVQARDYLQKLAERTGRLPTESREQLLASIEERLNEAEARDEVAATIVRLGSPDEVAASAFAAVASVRSRRRGDEWVVWLSAIVVAATIVGFACLGALLAVTAHFDEDADWNVHPALVLFAAGAGLLAGAFGTIITWASRRWSTRDKTFLTGLWVAAMILAVAAEPIALWLPLEVAWVISGPMLLLGAVAAVVVIGRAVRTTRSAIRM